jgi:tetratricopeptide (TPR) repeat protein
VPVVQSYRVFLYSLVGGRSKRSNRAKYSEDAISQGERLLTDPAVARLEGRDAVLLEVHNALGIAYTRRGQASEDPDQRQRFWDQALSHYESALQINPNVVRVLHNIGTLRMLQAESLGTSNIDASTELDSQALELFRRSLVINERDQFPHYRAAVCLLASTTGRARSSTFCPVGPCRVRSRPRNGSD